MLSNKKKLGIAKGGRMIKGLIYLLSGGFAITILGKNTDLGINNMIKNWSFGRYLIIIIIVGVFLFSIYRVYQALSDPGKTGLLIRIGYFLSGLFYFFLGFNCLQIAFGWGGEVVEAKDSLIGALMDTSFGKSLAGIGGGVLAGKSAFQFYKGFSGRFSRKINEANIDGAGKRLLQKLGKIGYSGRGIVIAIAAFVVYKTFSDPNFRITDVVDILTGTFGMPLLVIIGLGLVVYGVLMFVKSRYSAMDVK